MYIICGSIFHDTARAMLAHLAFDAGTFVGINPGGGCLSDVHLKYVRIWMIFSQKVAKK